MRHFVGRVLGWRIGDRLVWQSTHHVFFVTTPFQCATIGPPDTEVECGLGDHAVGGEVAAENSQAEQSNCYRLRPPSMVLQ